MKIDTIDLYQIHWPAWKGNPESASPGSIEEAVGELAKLKAEGKIRYSGVSNFDAAQMQRALGVAPVASLQPTRDRISTLPDDDWRKRSANFQEPLLSRNLQLVERLRETGRRYNATAGEIAIAWTLQNRAVTDAIVGVRSAQQARDIAGAGDIQLGVSDVLDIEPSLTCRRRELADTGAQESGSR